MTDRFLSLFQFSGAALLLTIFVAVFAFMAAWEIAVPRRAPKDKAARWMILTPDMHRVHHSADEGESSRNFSSIFSWWDRIFGTYRAAPAAGHEAMAIGPASSIRVDRSSLWRLIILHFINVNNPTNYEGGYRETLPAEIVSGQDNVLKKKQ